MSICRRDVSQIARKCCCSVGRAKYRDHIIKIIHDTRHNHLAEDDAPSKVDPDDALQLVVQNQATYLQLQLDRRQHCVTVALRGEANERLVTQ